jgi:hypothetical protein
MPADPDAEVHGFRQVGVAGARLHAAAESFIGPDPVGGAPPLPIGEVMGLAAVAPPVPVGKGAVGKEAAAVAGKGDKVRRVGRPGSEAGRQGRDGEQGEKSGKKKAAERGRDGEHGLFLQMGRQNFELMILTRLSDKGEKVV